jgi:beta-fructofuranosidase
LEQEEPLELRIFLDKSLVEVFANDRQAALAPHRYAAGNVGICLFSRGGDLHVREVTGWKMMSIYDRASP